jgi:hypothetical protein
MPLIDRLDHIILAAPARDPWISDFQRILALPPESMQEGHGTAAQAFNNVTFLLGNGFIGIVEPSGEESSLHRFLARFGEGFYGLSVGVRGFEAAQVALERHGIDHRVDPGLGLLWAGPRATHGVLYELVVGETLHGPSPNPSFAGLANLTIAVSQLDEAVRDYETFLGLSVDAEIRGDPPGTRGARFSLPASDHRQTIVLVEPTTSDGPMTELLKTRGEGLYSFGIAVTELDVEVTRLRNLGVDVTRSEGRAHIPPAVLRGLRVELWELA